MTLAELTDARVRALLDPMKCSDDDQDAAATAGLIDVEQSFGEGPFVLTEAGRHFLTEAQRIAADLTDEDIADMNHALGHDGGSFRNHFVTGADSTDDVLWGDLVKRGVAERGRDINDGRDHVYRVTPFGKLVVVLALRERRQGDR